jgi:hypothetical protein
MAMTADWIVAFGVGILGTMMACFFMMKTMKKPQPVRIKAKRRRR